MEITSVNNEKIKYYQKLKYRYLIPWVATSAIYLGILIFYSEVLGGTFLEGKAYPYDVFNFETLGWGKGLINCFIVLLAFNAVGAVIVFIDNKMKVKEVK